MAQVDITIQAATDAALATLLMAHGVLVAGEGGVRPAPGILHSHIGDAVLDGVALDGRYAFVGIDREAFGGPATDALLLSLQPHRYTGPDVRARLGGSGYRDPGVPPVVTMAQARLALLGAGKLAAVDAAIAAIPDAAMKQAAQIEWEYAGTVHRDHGLVSQIGPALGLTSAQIDALFVAASKL